MQDPNFYLTMAAAALAAVTIVALALLHGWKGWLALKHAEMAHGAKARGEDDAEVEAAPSAVTRIEMADIKERLRKLEAIAAGVDL